MSGLILSILPSHDLSEDGDIPVILHHPPCNQGVVHLDLEDHLDPYPQMTDPDSDRSKHLTIFIEIILFYLKPNLHAHIILSLYNSTYDKRSQNHFKSGVYIFHNMIY